MSSRRSNGKSRQSATSAYRKFVICSRGPPWVTSSSSSSECAPRSAEPTQSPARPNAGNTAVTPSPPSPTAPSCSPRRKGGDYVRRPMNPFMLFRSHVHRNGLISKKHQGDLSAAVAKMWNALSEEEKAPWKAEAERVKQEHMERYPGYTFTPGKKMSPSEVMAAKPLSESAGKAPTAVRTGTAATSPSKRPTTSAHSAAQHLTRTSTRKATQPVTATAAATPTTAIDHLEVFSNDGVSIRPFVRSSADWPRYLVAEQHHRQ